MTELNYSQIVEVNSRDRNPLAQLLLEKKVVKNIKEAKKIATDLREDEKPEETLKELFAPKPKA